MPFTLSVNFGFHGQSLLTFKTDRLDLSGLDPGKSDVKRLTSLKFQRVNPANAKRGFKGELKAKNKHFSFTL